VAAECREFGAQVMTHCLDIREPAPIDEFRRTAAFGAIDVWVNCAAVISFGRFEDVPAEAFQRVIETNILGYANGARAALSQFHAQGDRGTLINVGSLLGVVPEPYLSAYVTSKFAINGLTACLRQETRAFSNIHVCGVLPAAVDTPIYQHGANYMGRKARAIAPVYDPAKVAAAIVRLAESPRDQVVFSGFARWLAATAILAPSIVERVVARFAPQLQFTRCVAEVSAGNLFQNTDNHLKAAADGNIGQKHCFRNMLNGHQGGRSVCPLCGQSCGTLGRLPCPR